jgi:hypothetical protein
MAATSIQKHLCPHLNRLPAERSPTPSENVDQFKASCDLSIEVGSEPHVCCRKVTLHPAPCTLHPATCNLQPAPCTRNLHPTPYTLHPAPCTLHPAPCTLHPALYGQIISMKQWIWTSRLSIKNPSEECSQARLTRGTVTSTMRGAAHPSKYARCNAGAGCSTTAYQSFMKCVSMDNISGNEVENTVFEILLVKIMLCINFHCQNVLDVLDGNTFHMKSLVNKEVCLRSARRRPGAPASRSPGTCATSRRALPRYRGTSLI